tara:strand:- start:1477 stop:2037 length:561 start_codon:yes stop_codon:yes gene_type:complete
MKDEIIIQSVRCWVELFIVELNLCPFAKREISRNRVYYAVSKAVTEEQLLVDLEAELESLNTSTSFETCLLIHPNVLQNFRDYNQFLDLAESLLQEMELSGIFQIASFHPKYQFSGTGPDDAENYTNRSPYPVLHLLREDSLEKAIANYTDVDQIPEANITLMNQLGVSKLNAMLENCFAHTRPTD